MELISEFVFTLGLFVVASGVYELLKWAFQND